MPMLLSVAAPTAVKAALRRAFQAAALHPHFTRSHPTDIELPRRLVIHSLSRPLLSNAEPSPQVPASLYRHPHTRPSSTTELNNTDSQGRLGAGENVCSAALWCGSIREANHADMGKKRRALRSSPAPWAVQRRPASTISRSGCGRQFWAARIREAKLHGGSRGHSF
jgi:hypothetical protein